MNQFKNTVVHFNIRLDCLFAQLERCHIQNLRPFLFHKTIWTSLSVPWVKTLSLKWLQRYMSLYPALCSYLLVTHIWVLDCVVFLSAFQTILAIINSVFMLGASQTTHESWAGHTQDQAERKDRSFAITWRRKDCPTEKINLSFFFRKNCLSFYISQ